MNRHEEYVRKILSAINASGYLKSRESNTVEFKESFNKKNTTKYAKIMASYANNRGGYIIFGIKDNPREIVGLKNNNFENLNQDVFTDSINSLFAPSLDWECGIFTIQITPISVKSTTNFEKREESVERRIGWIYTEETENKPVIAQKMDNAEKITSGDVFYRYRARSEKIKFAEMRRIIEERMAKERRSLLKIFDVIQKSDTANLGIVNYSKGMITTPYGIDVAFDKKLVAQVLKKAKFIKEGSFNEINGAPVIKVTGNINLTEEVPVPELDPDVGYPFIQKDLAEKLGINAQDVYALVFYYKMKEAKKYSIGVTVSRSGRQNFKFSKLALEFLYDKLTELKNKDEEFEKIRTTYRNRNK